MSESPKSVTISLSGSTAEFVRAEVIAGGFPDVSAYLNKVLSDRQRQAAIAPLEQILLDAEDSPDIVADFQFWAELDADIDTKLNEGNAA